MLFYLYCIKQELFAGENVSVVELLYKYFIDIAADHIVSHDMQKVSFISGFDRLLKLGKYTSINCIQFQPTDYLCTVTYCCMSLLCSLATYPLGE